MADTKITALAAISTIDVNPATSPIPIVDLLDNSMAASGTTKKVTVNQILGAGGTATLASATITGDLTVDTSTLKVDSANNAVGVGTASPTANTLTIGANRFIICSDSQSKFGDNGLINGAAADGNTQIQFFGSKSLFFNEGVATRMTLNATGLGVGASPAERLTIGSSTAANYIKLTNTGATNGFLIGCFNTTVDIRNKEAGAMNFFTSDTQRMQIDSSGNVGIGVTPSAWGAGYTALQNRQTCWFATSSRDLNLGANVYVDAVGYKYIATAAASNYVQFQGAHSWYNAPSGTAGQTTTVTSGNSYTITAAGGTNYTTFGAANNNVGTTFTATSSGTGNGGGVTQNITFTQAMTLDASGRLLVNTASVIGGSGDTLQIAGKTTAGTDYCSMYTGTSTTVYGARYYHTSAVVGSITFTASGTAYNIASDYRLKEAVAPLTGGLARVSALKPSIYKWKVNGSDGEGFIAHELAEVIPAAVTGQKDAVNEDGSVQPQQVDLSKVVPILVAAIQELTARVQTLETR